LQSQEDKHTSSNTIQNQNQETIKKSKQNETNLGEISSAVREIIVKVEEKIQETKNNSHNDELKKEQEIIG